jgi:CheY-like chemotaxis protein
MTGAIYTELEDTTTNEYLPSDDAWRLAGAGGPRLLCVDDEPNVLEGLRLHLERRYRLSVATSGAGALALLDREGPCAIVVSDMRMPAMDGAVFLGQVRRRYPDTVRLLLTGHADINAAIAAVNEGQIFRFLTKPCPPSELLGALCAATDQYRLMTAERVLLEMTLHGSVKALTDVLALTHPLAAGRATRIRQSVTDLAERIGMKERWQVEVAAMLLHIGWVTLPAKTVEKLHYGQDLSAKEQEQVSEMPAIAARLLGNIPRLESVCEILVGAADRTRATSSTRKANDDLESKSAEMLRIASDYDTLESRGLSVKEALATMRGRGARYDAALLAAFAELRGGTSQDQTIKEIPLRSLVVGMVLVEDIRLRNGLVLAARGYEVTPQFVERAKNFQPSAENKSVRVVIWPRRGKS